MNKAWLLGMVVVISWLLVVPQLAVGQESDILVRTAVDPIDEVLVGQRIKLTIDVLAKDAWASLPRLPQIEVKGAIVYLPDGQSLRLSETIGGDSYSGQRYEWWAYPRRRGTVSIRQFEIEVNRKTFGANSDSDVTSTKTKPISLQATYPEGVQSANDLVCADNLKASEQWTPPTTDNFKVGDGVTRTITRTISGAPGMLLPLIPLENIDGVRAYPKQPGVNDTSNRGNLIGIRSDAVTYVFESAGAYTFPKTTFVWWNEGTSQLETIELPGRSFDVAAAPDVIAEPAAAARKQSSPQVGRSLFAVTATALLLAVVLYFSRSWIRQKYEELIASPIMKERHAFNELVAAARSNKTNATIRNLYRWMNFPLHDQNAPQIEVLLKRFGSEVDATPIQNLTLAESSDDWDSTMFIRACKRIRKTWHNSTIRGTKEKSFALPDLNPQS